jgi:2'-5' RNA ligase
MVICPAHHSASYQPSLRNVPVLFYSIRLGKGEDDCCGQSSMQWEFAFLRDEPARPKRPDRLFFALFPDAQTSRRIARFAERVVRDHRLEGRRIEAARLHVSLHHVGDYPRLRGKFVYAARRAGDAVVMRPFEVTFRAIRSFEGAPSIGGKPRRRPLVMLGEGEALLDLHKRLGAAMERHGLTAARAFTPHMTLLYAPKAVPVQAIEPIHVMIDDFSLVHSKLGLTQYDVVGRWPLCGETRRRVMAATVALPTCAPSRREEKPKSLSSLSRSRAGC